MNFPLPKSKALVPALIAFLAYKGKINIPGLLPIAVAQTLNTIKQNSPGLTSMLEFGALGDNTGTPRTYAQTVAQINRLSSPSPINSYNGLKMTDSRLPFSGYEQ